MANNLAALNLMASKSRGSTVQVTLNSFVFICAIFRIHEKILFLLSYLIKRAPYGYFSNMKQLKKSRDIPQIKILINIPNSGDFS